MRLSSTIYSTIALSVMAANAALLLNGCASDADIAAQNIARAADQFEINRRIVFYNGITDSYMLVIEGFCSMGNNDGRDQRTVTCKVGEREYKRHFLGLSDNVTYFAEQIDSADVSVHHYRVIFKPQSIVPDMDIRVDGSELPLPQVNR
jgi:hypothetical protein